MIKAWDRLATEREQGDWPAYGIPTGDINNIVVLDVDPRNGGKDSWISLYHEYKLSDTYTVNTGGGGQHHYYVLPQVGLRGQKLKAYGYEGIEFQANGQYVIGPGSLHPSGNRYEVMNNLPLAAIPVEFITMITQRLSKNPRLDPCIPPESQWPSMERRLDRALRYVATVPGAISGQDGHGTTLKVALALVQGFALSERIAYGVMAKYYNPKCRPSWSETELAHKIQSAVVSTKVPLGYMFSEAPSGFDILFEGETNNG